ncbi:hypothetical protein KVR01_010298 [Diaporthe batatas]|uniref:uncharacterized protein n=1 Tax=Diaporthe batatas TaxID=748121 RepID=UPI001D03A258|nr:uncharacterized protein KVR01_010298 [Diaporthe batatas]KAG8159661.1 hypothetical protein KVR01_010298 [Diaporthe batatas]
MVSVVKIISVVGFVLGCAATARRLPVGSWDSHIHIIDPERFPLDPDRDYTPKAASVANASSFETSLGIDHACIVLPSVYGTDNSILIDALRQFNGSYRGVAVIDPDNITYHDLAVLHEAGVRGMRINLDSQNSAEVSEAVRKNAEVAREWGWVVQLYTPLSALTYLHDIILESGVTVVFDHFGHTLVGSRTNVSMNTYDPYRTLGFPQLIDLVQRKVAFVKISGPYRDSDQAPFYEDMRVVAETIINAGPDMVVYGSDWPHTKSKEGNTEVGGRLQAQDFQDINDAALVEITKEWAGSDAQVQRLFVDNPRRLWQWYEDS